MNPNLPQPFPDINVSADYNPAIRLFGKRFINDQTIVEYAAEFLAVVFSEKWIGTGSGFNLSLPAWQHLQDWPVTASLQYRPPVKLNLKLFALLGSSRVDGRHPIHKLQYEKLLHNLQEKTEAPQSGAQQAIEYLEELLRGFRGAGFNRAWCAQSFYPLTASLLTQETIWNETVVRNNPPSYWDDAVQRFQTYYSVSKHRFMARGGELLYLQLCNVFRADQENILKLARQVGFSPAEADIQELHQRLSEGLGRLNGQYTGELDRLVEYIDGLDPYTQRMTNREKPLECEWCPQESWPEGYLFAVELQRLLYAALDPVERLELFMTGCALQVLRSLCAQALRYVDADNVPWGSSGPGYAWILSSAKAIGPQRRAAQGNLQVIQGLIQKALRHEKLQANALRGPKGLGIYKEADSKYGHKLFLSLGKRLGIIQPYRGPGARLIMSDRLLRYFVLTLIPPGKSCTYDDFLKRMYLHYGIAVEGTELAEALRWIGWPPNRSMQSEQGSWLQEMLRAGGFLMALSDACSIVENPFREIKTGTGECL